MGERFAKFSVNFYNFGKLGEIFEKCLEEFAKFKTDLGKCKNEANFCYVLKDKFKEISENFEKNLRYSSKI